MSQEPTRWSRIEHKDYAYLVERFEKPVRRFIGAQLHDPAQAEDLTQELFLSLLRRDFLDRVDGSRGALRSLLFHCARQFLTDHFRRTDRLVHEGWIEERPDPDRLPASEAFDLEWYRSLLNQARRDVKTHYLEQDLPVAYRAFRLFYFGDSEPGSWTQHGSRRLWWRGEVIGWINQQREGARDGQEAEETEAEPA